MIHNEAETIKAALEAIDGVRSVTRGWPRSFEQLPCIAISKAGETPIAFGDDKAYVTEVEYNIRIFADKAVEADAIAPETDAAMAEMGYMRTFSYDQDDAEVRVQVMRYKKML